MKFAESCLTLSLKNSEIFISSFPGKIVFGEPNSYGYINSKSFQYNHHQFFNLYLSFVNIIHFFASSSNENDKGLILTQSQNTIYFWTGKIVVQENQVNKRVIKFGLEIDDNITFEIILTSEQFNELVYAFSTLILSCLCLKSFERQFIEEITEELSIIKLLSFKNKKVSNKAFRELMKSKNIDIINESNILQLMVYYNEIIILYKKIKNMYNLELIEVNRIDAILKD
jgi:hypothetical protein